MRDLSDPSAQLKTWALSLATQHPAWNTSGKGKQVLPTCSKVCGINT